MTESPAQPAPSADPPNEARGGSPAPAAEWRGSRALLYFIFALSGAAALIYESIWSRYLGLFLGHSAYAQILVMTIFLGGMAGGAAITSLFTARLRRPLVWYAGTEALVGLMGLVFHVLFLATTNFSYDTIFPALAGSAALLLIVKWAIAAALILPQSILLGATFPLMSAGVIRRDPERAGETLGWLYASNSFGGAVGVLVAGFYLVSRFDFPGTLTTAALINLGVAVATLAVMTRAGGDAVGPHRPALAIAATAAPPRLLLLSAAFATAVASFFYEIAWIRMLSLVLGSSTHSFELMLSAFLLGLALGALWVRKRADRLADPVRALGLVQCAMGVLAVATLPLYVESFEWTAGLFRAFQRTAEGYAGFTLARYLICLVIMLPATFCAGITLPLITRILYRSGAAERAIGEVYAMNTAGSIIGVQLAGLYLLPLIGLKFLLVAGAALDAGLGLALLYYAARWKGTSFRPLALTAVATVVVMIVGAQVARFDQALLGSGVFREGSLPGPGDWVTTFFQNGRTATVSVRRTQVGDLVLATNGKPDASVSASWLNADTANIQRMPLRDDEETQVLLPLVALAHAPQARTGAMIGHGSGMSSNILLASPSLEELVTIEIEPEMIRGSLAFFPLNRRTFEDPRARFVVDDAKSYFAAAGRRFDLILSEPSNPWVSGVSGLFTTEFYERVRRYLTPDGVFAQWLHLYELNDGLARGVLAAVQENFPVYEVFLVGDADVVILATPGDSLPRPDWSVLDLPGIQQDLRHVLPLTPGALESLRLADSHALGPFVATAEPNSDFAPALDLGGERARFLGTDAAGLRTLTVFSVDIASALSGRRVEFGSETWNAGGVERLRLRALSAWLRQTDETTRSQDPLIEEARDRRRAFDAGVRTGLPPAHWGMWLLGLLEIDRAIHAGSAGVVDVSLYQPLDAYLTIAKAPPEIWSSVAFLEALNGWDFPTASAAADSLLAGERRGELWIAPDYLRDGAVVAKLMTGDLDGAQAAFATLLPRVRTDAVGVFRTGLLSAHIAAARVAAEPPAGGP